MCIPQNVHLCVRQNKAKQSARNLKSFNEDITHYQFCYNVTPSYVRIPKQYRLFKKNKQSLNQIYKSDHFQNLKLSKIMHCVKPFLPSENVTSYFLFLKRLCRVVNVIATPCNYA